MENLAKKIDIMNNENYPVFSERCFWEQDYTKLDFDKGKRYIITRVISYGSQNDYIELFRYYGWNTVKEEVVHINYLNKKILNFLSVIFEINKKDFREYDKRSLF
jgi:hypothetical protein